MSGPPPPEPRYVVATPAKNERAILPELVAATDALSPRPAVWLVVDDGSTDGSREWLEEEARTRPWMLVRDAPERSEEYLGGHVARIKRWALAEAIAAAAPRGGSATYAGVLDADILPPPDHYARLIDAMERDMSLGIVSSAIASTDAAGVVTMDPFQRSDEPRGGTQFFRVTCLDAIGGLPPWPGFDGAANVKARARGFRTALVPDVVAVQRREMAARFGAAAGYGRRGRYAWFLGVHPLLVAARAGAYALTVGPSAGGHFLSAWLGEAVRGKPRCPDPEVRELYGWRRVKEAALGVVGKGRRFVRR